MQKELTAEIFGKVQGVGFRAYLRWQADELGVVGYVRNDPDGHVEVVAQGEEEALKEFEKYMRKGPISANISEVDIEWHDVLQDSFTEFSIR